MCSQDGTLADDFLFWLYLLSLFFSLTFVTLVSPVSTRIYTYSQSHPSHPILIQMRAMLKTQRTLLNPRRENPHLHCITAIYLIFSSRYVFLPLPPHKTKTLKIPNPKNKALAWALDPASNRFNGFVSFLSQIL